MDMFIANNFFQLGKIISESTFKISEFLKRNTKDPH